MFPDPGSNSWEPQVMGTRVYFWSLTTLIRKPLSLSLSILSISDQPPPIFPGLYAPFSLCSCLSFYVNLYFYLRLCLFLSFSLQDLRPLSA